MLLVPEYDSPAVSPDRRRISSSLSSTPPLIVVGPMPGADPGTTCGAAVYGDSPVGGATANRSFSASCSRSIVWTLHRS